MTDAESSSDVLLQITINEPMSHLIHSNNIFSIKFTYAFSIQKIPMSNNQIDTLIDKSISKLIQKSNRSTGINSEHR